MTRALSAVVLTWAWTSLVLAVALVAGFAGVLVAALPSLDVPLLAAAITSTAWLCLAAAALAFPMAAAAAITLDQQLVPGPVATGLRAALQILDGTPGLVAGVVVALLVGPMGGPAAVVALSIVATPSLARGFQRALSRVRAADRRAASALGASAMQILLYVMVPAAGRAMVASTMRTVARLAGAAAPLLLVGPMNSEPLVLVLVRQASRGAVTASVASAAILIAIISAVYLMAAVVDRQPRWGE